MKINKQYKIFDNAEKAYVRNNGEDIKLFNSKLEAEKWIEHDLTLGNYPDHTYTVYKIIES